MGHSLADAEKDKSVAKQTGHSGACNVLPAVELKVLVVVMGVFSTAVVVMKVKGVCGGGRRAAALTAL